METFKTKFHAHRYAKNYFASLLNISPNSVRVKQDTFYNDLSVKCVCGYCSVVYFEMSNVTEKQIVILQSVIDRPGAVIALSICKDCGVTY